MIHARKDYMRIQDPENKIADDEPVFLMRAKDDCMVYALEAWIHAAKMRNAKQDIVQSAENHLKLVRQWQQENGTKTPDI